MPIEDFSYILITFVFWTMNITLLLALGHHMDVQIYWEIIIIIARVVAKVCLPAQDAQGQIYKMR